jgi:hypothetical protein
MIINTVPFSACGLPTSSVLATVRLFNYATSLLKIGTLFDSANIGCENKYGTHTEQQVEKLLQVRSVLSSYSLFLQWC